MAGSDQFSFEWFEKPPGHSSPMHDHENEQVCLCLEGELTVATEDDSVTLQKNDSVLLESNETQSGKHRRRARGRARRVRSRPALVRLLDGAKSERTMKYLARTATGDPLLGDDEGGTSPSAPSNPIWGASGKHSRAAAAGTLGDVADATADPVPAAADISFGAPLESFGKLWGIGLNYAEHAGDLDEQRPDEPASFMKPSSVLTGPSGPIRLPPESQSERVTAEAELAVVMGRTCRNVEEAAFEDVVAGFLPVIDMTAEDVLQRNPRFLTRSKSYDTFLVPGAALAVPEEPLDLDALRADGGQRRDRGRKRDPEHAVSPSDRLVPLRR